MLLTTSEFNRCDDCPVLTEAVDQLITLENAILIIAGAMREGEIEYAKKVLDLQERRIIVDRAAMTMTPQGLPS